MCDPCVTVKVSCLIVESSESDGEFMTVPTVQEDGTEGKQSHGFPPEYILSYLSFG